MEAPKPLNNINLYHLDKEDRTKLGVKELPGSLAEALTELDQDEVIKSALGENTYEVFARAKWELPPPLAPPAKGGERWGSLS